MKYNQAYERVQQLKKFYKNLLWFGIVAAIIAIRNYYRTGDFERSVFSGSIILAVWGIILIVKAVKLFILNEEWENRIYEDELKKAKKPINF
jgi:NADH:ubiquinone oxidoreductase subunit 2 (subunit N)